jgi:hypothetical protein
MATNVFQSSHEISSGDSYLLNNTLKVQIFHFLLPLLEAVSINAPPSVAMIRLLTISLSNIAPVSHQTPRHA